MLDFLKDNISQILKADLIHNHRELSAYLNHRKYTESPQHFATKIAIYLLSVEPELRDHAKYNILYTNMLHFLVATLSDSIGADYTQYTYEKYLSFCQGLEIALDVFYRDPDNTYHSLDKDTIDDYLLFCKQYRQRPQKTHRKFGKRKIRKEK